jgi:hypothetical protein
VDNNTGESSPLGRQLVCDAVRVRARLGIPEIISQGPKTPSLRRGVRSSTEPSVFAPRDWEIIPSNADQVGFRWNQINQATQYHLQISTQDFGDSGLENKSTNCDDPCFSVLTSEPNHLATLSQFAPNMPYYWRVRSETTEFNKPASILLHFSQWSDIRQFSVIEAPTEGGNYPIKCREFREPNGIQFYDKLTKQWTAEGGPYYFEGQIHNNLLQQGLSPTPMEEGFSEGEGEGEGEGENSQLESDDEIPSLESMAAWAQICYPVVGNQPLSQMPIALFLAGNFPNCKLQEQGKEAGYFDWEGKYTPDLQVEIVPPGVCPEEKIIPSHRGFDYLLEELASHGIFAISISPHEIQGHNELWNFLARAELILQFIDKLEDWNENGRDPFGPSKGQQQDGIFHHQLDLHKILLVGHSRGGEAVLAAQELKKDRGENNSSIVAIVAIAPTRMSGDSLITPNYEASDPYYLLLGARDNDIVSLSGLATYQLADNTNATKNKAIVYGANHNYFNTEWAKIFDEAAGVSDPALIMDPAEQQAITLTTVTAFSRWHLQNEQKYREMFTGRYKHDRIYWAYHTHLSKQVIIDDFELERFFNADPHKNILGGKNTCQFKDFLSNWFKECEFKEKRLYFIGEGFPGKGLEPDFHFFEDTIGMRLNWSVSFLGSTAVYRTEIVDFSLPEEKISQVTHLSLLAANVEQGDENPLDSDIQTSINLAITLEIKEANGKTIKRSHTVDTKNFGRIPHPYQRTWEKCQEVSGICVKNQQAVLIGIRIPLTEFGFTTEELQAGVLANLHAIEIEMDAAGNPAGNIALDDIILTQ